MGGEGIELVVGDDLTKLTLQHISATESPLTSIFPGIPLEGQLVQGGTVAKLPKSIRQIGVVFGIAGIKIIHSFQGLAGRSEKPIPARP